MLELLDVAVHYEAAELLVNVWGQKLMDPGLIRAFSFSGNYVAGAYLGDELVGVAIGFRTGDGDLHSHVTGVVAGAQKRGVGRALKMHQRDWCLERGIGHVVWTFDPLVRRNAYFNIHKLGAIPVRYLRDFYGAMEDDVNDGLPSDRLYVDWDLRNPAPPVPPPSADLVAAGAGVLLDQADDEPLPAAVDELPARVLVAVPADIEALRGARPVVAGLWRLAVRSALQRAFDAGYSITGITRDGFYVLEGDA